MQRTMGFIVRASLAVAALALPSAGSLKAADYPSRPPHIIVGYPAGGSTDVVARLIGDWLSKRLGQQFIVENRPGAGNNLATEAVAKAPPDGYTLILVNHANTVNASLYKNLNFNYLRDTVAVGGFARTPLVMEVNPSVPAKTVPEFIAYAKANPGKINMASAGIGTSSHLAGELFKMMTSINLVHIPYRGSPPALTDLIAGHVQVFFITTAASIGYIRAGTLRALAVTTATRSKTLPDIPTVGEFVPNYEATAVWGLGAPRDTPIEIINKLNTEVNAAFADPKMNSRLANLGSTPLPGSPADFGKLIAEET